MPPKGDQNGVLLYFEKRILDLDLAKCVWVRGLAVWHGLGRRNEPYFIGDRIFACISLFGAAAGIERDNLDCGD